MQDADFISGAEMIQKVFSNISPEKINQSNKIMDSWQKTVSKISGNGEQLASHSRVADLKNGILLVETDHPGWSQMLQLHKKFILTGMNRLCGGVKIDSLAFKIKGSNATLGDSEEIARRATEKYAQKLDAEQKILEEKGFVNNSDSAQKKAENPLPQEIMDIFNRLKGIDQQS